MPWTWFSVYISRVSVFQTLANLMPRVWRARGAQPKVNVEVEGVSRFFSVGVLKVAPEAKVSFYGTPKAKSFYPAQSPGIFRAPELGPQVVDETNETSTAYCSQRSRCSSAATMPRSFYKPVKRSKARRCERSERLRQSVRVDPQEEERRENAETAETASGMVEKAEQVKSVAMVDFECSDCVEKVDEAECLECEEARKDEQPQQSQQWQHDIAKEPETPKESLKSVKVSEELPEEGDIADADGNGNEGLETVETAETEITSWIRLPDQKPWADSLDDPDEECFCGIANWPETPESQSLQWGCTYSVLWCNCATKFVRACPEIPYDRMCSLFQYIPECPLGKGRRRSKSQRNSRRRSKSQRSNRQRSKGHRWMLLNLVSQVFQKGDMCFLKWKWRQGHIKGVLLGSKCCLLTPFDRWLLKLIQFLHGGCSLFHIAWGKLCSACFSMFEQHVFKLLVLELQGREIPGLVHIATTMVTILGMIGMIGLPGTIGVLMALMATSIMVMAMALMLEHMAKNRKTSKVSKV